MKTDSLYCDRRTYSENPYNHIHNFAQLVIPIRGTLSIEIERNRYEETEPKVLFVPPDTFHSFHAKGGNRFFVFDIPSTLISSENARYGLCYTLDERWRAVRTLLQLEVGDGEAISTQRILDLFRYILHLLEKPALSPSLAFIRENYHQDLSLTELATLEHYHVSYYSEWFQKQTGITPMEYIRQMRLQNAKTLLAETSYTLLQIAQQVGFANQATLTRLFQKYEGETPSDYRKKHRKTVKK